MRIGFFGCSFTEGGGLDSFEWNDYALKNNLISDDWDITKLISDYNKEHHLESRYSLVTDYRDKFKFSNLVGEQLGYQSTNHAISCNSNDNIFNQLEDNLSKYDIFIVQTTLLQRVYWWYELTEQMYNINSTDFNNAPYSRKKEMKKLSEIYNDWISYIYNKEQVCKNIRRQISYFNEKVKSLDKKIYWILWENLEYGGKDYGKDISNLIKFESESCDYSLSKFSYENGTHFTELTNGEYDDSHLSPEGHQIVTKKIIEVLNER